MLSFNEVLDGLSQHNPSIDHLRRSGSAILNIADAEALFKAGFFQHELNKDEPYEQCCSKCGSKDIYRKFYPLGRTSHFMNKESQPVDPKRILNGMHNFVTKVDCIVHRCRMCEYTWAGATLPGRD